MGRDFNDDLGDGSVNSFDQGETDSLDQNTGDVTQSSGNVSQSTVGDAGQSTLGKANQEKVEEINNPRRFRGGQGCSTFICFVIITVVIFCKVRGITFQELTKDYIEYDDEMITESKNRLVFYIFPTSDSYTAILDSNNNCMIVNCAENFFDENIQDIISKHYRVDELFLLSDVTYYDSEVNTDSIHASSVFADDVFCNGEYTENEIDLFGGKLRYLMQDDILNVHYTDDGGDTFKVEFCNAKGKDLDQLRSTDILINSQGEDLSSYAETTYLDNNGTEKHNLSDYKEITVNFLNGETKAVLCD